MGEYTLKNVEAHLDSRALSARSAIQSKGFRDMAKAVNAAASALTSKDEEIKRLREAASDALTLAVIVQAFVRRDRGTPRIDRTLDGIIFEATKVDATIRAALHHGADNDA